MTLPVYYTYVKNGKKTKMLIGLNIMYRLHCNERAKLEKWFALHVKRNVNKVKIPGKYQVRYRYFYKNVLSDAPNVIAAVDKMFVDALQAEGVLEQDNVKYYVGCVWEVAEQDRNNPRVEASIIKVSD